jgi:hypothetical protein
MGINPLSLQLSHRFPVPDPEPQLDLAKIAFPTDRLSIKDLRKLFPAEFDARDNTRVHYFHPHGSRRMLAFMLDTERDLARTTFEIAMGRAHNIDKNTLKDIKKDLAELWIEHGLASGLHHAGQQIRDIETQVVEQTKSFGPPPHP